jgi:hypothetical protein
MRKNEEFFIDVTARDLKGSVIGDPENCTGARCIKKQTEAVWVWVGVTVAIIGYSNGRLIRSEHNGEIPRSQDEGFFPIGRYKFRAPRPSNGTKARQERRKAAEKRGVHRPPGGIDKVGNGSLKAKSRESSIAAQLRH